MTTLPFYRDLTFWMYVVAGSPYAAFVAFYAWRSPAWRDTPIGRALMSLNVSLTAVFAYICLLLAVPVNEDIKDMLRALLIGGVTISGALMLKNLLTEQRRGRDEAAAHDPA